MPEHRDRVVELLRQVVAIPTAYPPGDATQISAASVSQLKRMGYRTDAHAEVAGLVNVVASIGEGAPHLVFNAHVDTVTFTFVTDEESLGDRGMAYLREAGHAVPWRADLERADHLRARRHVGLRRDKRQGRPHRCT